MPINLQAFGGWWNSNIGRLLQKPEDASMSKSIIGGRYFFLRDYGVHLPGSTSCSPSKIKLAFATPGFARAMHDHRAPCPKWARATLQSVSPMRIVRVETTPLVSVRRETGTAAVAGSLSWAPARIWFGFAIHGFAATSSGQRLPRPRVSCASFQRESPLRTVTLPCLVTIVGVAEGLGCTGRSVSAGTMGATGCAG